LPWVAAGTVAALTLWRWTALYLSDVDLFFDEAQYWFWGQSLEFGYFSKPPLLGWSIAGSTALLGDSEFGIRAFAPLFYALTALFGGLIAWELAGARAAAWSAVMLALLPGVSLSATVASTDVPLLLCWSAALYCLLRYGRDGGWWWLGLGMAWGLGLLAKYAMAYFALGVALSFALVPATRQAVGRPGFWAAVVLALAMFGPNVWWNWANDFVSFGHTAENANWRDGAFRLDKLFDFWGGQFGVMGPILLVAFLVGLGRWRYLTAGERWLACFALPVLVLMSGQALAARAHANWAATAYIPATVVAVCWLSRTARTVWLKASAVLHLAAAAVVLHGASLLPLVGADPWHRQRGWEALGAEVTALKAAHPEAVLVATDRKLAAELMYYMTPRLPNLVKWNADGQVDDHYELVTDMSRLEGQTVLLIGRPWGVESALERFAEFLPLASLRRERPTRPPEEYRVALANGFKGL